ncbi:MAG: ankyrin repeat domain-containing protein [Candidatus Babeliales bacterium]
MVSRTIFTKIVTSILICCFVVGTLEGMKKGKKDKLFDAILLKNSAAVSELITRGVDVNVRDRNGWTPLMLATWRDAGDIVEKLLAAGADVEMQSPLEITAQEYVKSEKVGQLIKNALDKKYARLDKEYAPRRCLYRNLIIIIHDGSELAKDAGSGIMLGDFISALEEACAFILIPSAMWDYFLHATVKGTKIAAKELFNPEQWDVYKICLNPAKNITPKEQQANFYIFCPKKYTEQLQSNSTIQSIKQAIQIIPGPIDPKIAPDIEAINALSDLGINVSEQYKVSDPFRECGGLGKILKPYEQEKKALEEEQKRMGESQDLTKRLTIVELEQKIAIIEYAIKNLDKTFGVNLLRCLEQILSLRTAKAALSNLESYFENNEKVHAALGDAELILPQYNVYIDGHGEETKPPAQVDFLINRLENLLDRAKALGYWPSNWKIQLSSTEIAHLTEATDVEKHKELTAKEKEAVFGKREKTRPVEQKFKKESEHFNAEQEVIGAISDLGKVAALPINVFSKVLELFNGVANLLFFSTCHGGGAHLVLPFVFMSAPQSLSYTLVNGALLDVPVTGLLPNISELKHEDGAQIGAAKYSVVTKIKFRKFFDGISDFATFVRNEEKKIEKTGPKNYFARLLNYGGTFLGPQGEIKRPENMPWIKLPGPTDWHVVSYMDDQALVITDVMVRAKELEKKIVEKKPLKPASSILTEGAKARLMELPSEISALEHKIALEPQEEIKKKLVLEFQEKQRQLEKLSDLLGISKEEVLTVEHEKMTPRQLAAWRKKWGVWEKKRKQLEPSSDAIIDASQKKYIFAATNDIRLTIKFGHTQSTKAIIPTAMPERFFDANVIYFEGMESDDPFATFFNLVLNPKEPLVATPPKTIFFIKNLTCKNDFPSKVSSLPADARITLDNCMVVFDASLLSDYAFYFSYKGKHFCLKREDDSFKIEEFSLDKALRRAVVYGRTNIVKLLIKAGANINAKDIGYTALGYAATLGRIHIVAFLLNAGANKELDVALRIAHTPEIRRLIENALEKQKPALLMSSPGFKKAQKKALQMEQQSVARNVWKQAQAGAKFDIESIIKAQLMGFDTLIQRLRESPEEKKPAAPF